MACAALVRGTTSVLNLSSGGSYGTGCSGNVGISVVISHESGTRATSLSHHQGVVVTAIVGTAVTSLQHLAPHVTGARLAEVQFSLNVGFQRLNISEDQWEHQQAPSDGNGAEDNSGEGDQPRGALLVMHL
jgi:hypothetical protein